LNLNLNVNNERQDCKIGTVRRIFVGGGGGMKEIKMRKYG
jgi:hypothetical protein